jgi:hypothetical protein
MNEIRQYDDNMRGLYMFDKCKFKSITNIDQIEKLLDTFKETEKIKNFEINHFDTRCVVLIFVNFKVIEIVINNDYEEEADEKIISDVVDNNVEEENDIDGDELQFYEPYKLDNDFYEDNKEIYDSLLNFFNLKKEQLFNDFS